MCRNEKYAATSMMKIFHVMLNGHDIHLVEIICV